MSEIKKLAVMGGTFNPIHKAHVYMLQEFLKKYEVDKVLLIPTAIPPHKEYVLQVSDEDRMNMCKLAVKDIPKVEVSNIEIKRGGASYTYETLRELKDNYENPEIYFIMGADMFQCFSQWKNPQEILNLASLCVVPRNSTQVQDLLKIKAMLSSIYCSVCADILDVGEMKLSSTYVRDMLKRNEDVSDFLSAEVYDYIKQHKLYR